MICVSCPCLFVFSECFSAISGYTPISTTTTTATAASAPMFGTDMSFDGCGNKSLYQSNPQPDTISVPGWTCGTVDGSAYNVYDKPRPVCFGLNPPGWAYSGGGIRGKGFLGLSMDGCYVEQTSIGVPAQTAMMITFKAASRQTLPPPTLEVIVDGMHVYSESVSDSVLTSRKVACTSNSSGFLTLRFTSGGASTGKATMLLLDDVSITIQSLATTTTKPVVNAATTRTITTIVTTVAPATIVAPILTGEMCLRVKSANRFCNDVNVMKALRSAVAEIANVSVDWVYNTSTHLRKSRVLLVGSKYHTPRWLLQDDASQQAVVFRFHIQFTDEGVIATMILLNFNAKSLEYATRAVMKRIPPEAAASVIWKYVWDDSEQNGQHSSHSPPTQEPFESKVFVLVFVFLMCLAILSLCCFTVPVTLYAFHMSKSGVPIDVADSAENHAQVSDNSGVESRGLLSCATQPFDFSISKLLCPPNSISRTCGLALFQHMSTVVAKSEGSDVFIIFAPDSRREDADVCGPGHFYAAAVMKALVMRYVRCQISAYGSGDDTMQAIQTRYKLLVVLESDALYKCSRCLEDIHDAISKGVDICRLRIDVCIPPKSERWLSQRGHDKLEVEMVVDRLDLSHHWSDQSIHDQPELLAHVVHDIVTRSPSSKLCKNRWSSSSGAEEILECRASGSSAQHVGQGASNPMGNVQTYPEAKPADRGGDKSPSRCAGRRNIAMGPRLVKGPASALPATSMATIQGKTRIRRKKKRGKRMSNNMSSVSFTSNMCDGEIQRGHTDIPRQDANAY